MYGFEPGASLPAHRHEATEHVWTVLAGAGSVRVDDQQRSILAGDTMLVPAGARHGIQNTGTERMLVQQVSTPKPWDARFGGPHPAG